MMTLLLKSSILNGVPFNEYYLEDVEPKGLVFIQHGYQSNKDYGADYLALHIARSGYFVVSIDAYKHGARIEEPYLSKDEKVMLIEAPIVIRHTAIDIIKLHKLRYKKRFAKYDFIGISMGAMIAYYLCTKTDKIKKLLPIIGIPDFMYQAEYNLNQAGLLVPEFLTPDAIKYLQRMSPINNVHKMKYDKMCILSGTKDQIVPIKPSVDFIKKYKDDSITFITYEDGHNVNRSMQEDIFKIIEN